MKQPPSFEYSNTWQKPNRNHLHEQPTRYSFLKRTKHLTTKIPNRKKIRLLQNVLLKPHNRDQERKYCWLAAHCKVSVYINTIISFSIYQLLFPPIKGQAMGVLFDFQLLIHCLFYVCIAIETTIWQWRIARSTPPTTTSTRKYLYLPTYIYIDQYQFESTKCKLDYWK